MVQLRNSGWILVTRQWRGGGAQSKEGKNGFFTVFVDNIPSVMDAKALYKLFSKFGIVKDAYIPFKRRKVMNSRFGFVRYDCRISASVAIQKAKGLFVDDMMLVVKMATYDRNNRSKQSKRKSQDTKRSMYTTNIRGSAAYVGHRSFAEVLKGDTSVLDGQ
ncbi:probable splicing factor, arginine/serine-rich 4 [Camellia sinensis]|uniref:probable splicing factor, arginine/serine-rich 4 n=1 Tax=Camellia sinensis TaxID=4442 RepID=UPI0010357288|nr:probable splicing factor, arginine/serine-rich 4 [Camellia sinensis]